MNRYCIKDSKGKILKRGFNNREEARAQREEGQHISKDVEHPLYVKETRRLPSFSKSKTRMKTAKT